MGVKWYLTVLVWSSWLLVRLNTFSWIGHLVFPSTSGLFISFGHFCMGFLVFLLICWSCLYYLEIDVQGNSVCFSKYVCVYVKNLKMCGNVPLNFWEDVILGEKRNHGNLAVSIIHYKLLRRKRDWRKYTKILRSVKSEERVHMWIYFLYFSMLGTFHKQNIQH